MVNDNIIMVAVIIGVFALVMSLIALTNVGLNGIDGINGLDGIDGIQGVQGVAGVNGTNLVSPYACSLKTNGTLNYIYYRVYFYANGSFSDWIYTDGNTVQYLVGYVDYDKLVIYCTSVSLVYYMKIYNITSGSIIKDW